MNDLVQRLRVGIQELEELTKEHLASEGQWVEMTGSQRDRIAELENQLIEQRRIHSRRVEALEAALRKLASLRLWP